MRGARAMKQILNYNIHDIMRFQIIRDRKREYLRDLNLLFSYFEVKEETANPDITLNIGKFSPSNQNCYLVDHKYYIKENYFYCKDEEGRARWEVEIYGFEDGDTAINFDGRVFGSHQIFMPELLPQNLFLMPLIGYKLNKKQCFLVHSAAIAKDGQACLLAGRGGAFKTALALDFVGKKGFQFLGDDGVIICPNNVLSFPISLGLVSYKLRYPVRGGLEGFHDRIRAIRYLRKEVDYDSMPLAQQSRLKAIFFMVKTNKQIVDKAEVDLKKAVSQLAKASNLEAVISPCPMVMPAGSGRYLKYMLAYSFVFPNSQIAKYWSDLEKRLAQVLTPIPIYEIKIPQDYTPAVFNEVWRCLEQAL